jgi:membrane associated rhomboid family serine protease
MAHIDIHRFATILKDYPVTLSTIILINAAFVVQHGFPVLCDHILRFISYSDNKVFIYIVYQFMHLNFLHLVMNLLSLVSFMHYEKLLGSLKYSYYIIYFALVTPCVFDSMHAFCTFNDAIGFSGVLFGMITMFPSNIFFGYTVNPNYFPFLNLAVLSLIPNVSFIGHLSGIIAAYFLKAGMSL